MESLKLETEALSAQIMDNKALLAQSRANIEENRLLVLSNYAAAMGGNQQLASHNLEEIFASRTAILDLFECETDDQRSYVKAAKARSELDLLGHNASLNAKNLALSEKMIELNQHLIAINQEVMQINQAMLEFNEENLSTNTELMSGVLNPLLASTEATEELVAENHASLADLQALANKNRETVADLLQKTKENRATALVNKTQIGERKQKLYQNRDDIYAMRKGVGSKVTYSDLFLGDVEEE